MTYQVSADRIAVIASVWAIKAYMMVTLAAISPAPSQTSSAFQRQMRSTRWPSGILSAQGMTAQKVSPARKAADSPR